MNRLDYPFRASTPPVPPRVLLLKDEDGDGVEFVRVRRVTRAEMQARIDTAYGRGEISREVWREKTAELSDVEQWSAEGFVARPSEGRSLKRGNAS